MRLHTSRHDGQIVKRPAFLHIGALRHFQLHGVDALRRLAVLACDVTAICRSLRPPTYKYRERSRQRRDPLPVGRHSKSPTYPIERKPFFTADAVSKHLSESSTTDLRIPCAQDSGGPPSRRSVLEESDVSH
jgi:hypothetical protein